MNVKLKIGDNIMNNSIDYSKLNEYLINRGYKFDGAISVLEEHVCMIDYICPNNESDDKRILRVFAPIIDFNAQNFDFKHIKHIEGHIRYSNGGRLVKVIEPDFSKPEWQQLRSED